MSRRVSVFWICLGFPMFLACQEDSAAPAAPTPPAAPAVASPAPVPVPQGTVYGEALTLAESVKVSDLLDRPADFEGKRVRVEGLVTDVCAKRGCWFKLAGDRPYDTLTFKVTDGVMVFPMSAKGKYAVAEGLVSRRELTLAQTRDLLEHEAAEQGREFVRKSVKKPMTYVRLEGLGAVIRDSR